MNKVQISHASVDKSLERCKSDTLENSSPYYTGIVLSAASPPSAADDNDNCAQKIQMPLSPDSCRGDEYEARNAYAQKMIAGQKRNLREGPFEP